MNWCLASAVGTGIAVVSVILVAGVLCGCSGNPVALRLSLQPGDKLTIIDSMRQVSDVTLNGQPVQANVAGECRVDVVVDGVTPSGDYECRAEIRKAVLTEDIIVGGAVSNGMDNAAGRTPLEEVGHWLSGRQYRFTLTPRGEVIAVEGAEEIAKHLKENGDFLPAAAQPASPSEAEAFAEGFYGTWDERGLAGFTESLFPVLPDSDVAKGDSWQGQRGMDPGDEAVRDVTYTLTGVDSQVARIAFDAAIRPRPASDSTVQGGHVRGTLTVDTASGVYETQTEEGSLETYGVGAMTVASTATITGSRDTLLAR